jgi:thiol-disulfide isomerase/thioredoxin
LRQDHALPFPGVASARENVTPQKSMKTNVVKWMATILALAAGPLMIQAAEGPTLKVGDQAPKLQVGKWVQGDPVKEFDKSKAYIVEFWATWCGPCRVSIPHLNEVHKKYKDKGLIVIGQDVWERDESAVEPFVKKMGDKMTYRVAMDDKSKSEQGAMAETWMTAAGQGGIPSAFVVDKQGRIAWIGHPMELKEKTLEQVLDGTFDVKKAAAAQAEAQKNEQQLMALSRDLGASMRAQKWDSAEATIKEMEKLLPEEHKDALSMARVQIHFGKKDYKGAYKLIEQVSDNNKDNAMLQGQLAWDIATREGLEERDLKLAEKIATRANDAASGKDPAILDTLARVQFMNGKKDKAVETQQKAVALADADSREKLQEFLDSYKAGKLPKLD